MLSCALNKNFEMKSVKYIISLIVLLLCFALNGELYQVYLQNFTNGFYFFEIEYPDREILCDELISAANKYGQIVFAVKRRNYDAFHSRLTVYTIEKAREALEQELGIVDDESGSLFSGTTEVSFRPLIEIVNSPEVVRFYFTGSKEEVLRIRQLVNSHIAASYIHIEEKNGTEYIVYALWVLAFGFLALLTWIDIQFSRKAVFLRISMGASVSTEIWKCILGDLLFAVTALTAAYGILGRFFYTSFRLDVVMLAFLVFCVVNSLLYLSFARGDYKEIIYGANIDQKLLPNAYLMKALVLILLVLSSSCTMTLINNNAGWLESYHMVDKMGEYYTIQLTHPCASFDLCPEEEDARYARETQLYLEAYREGKVLLANCWGFVQKGEVPTIVMNAPALPMLLSHPEYFQSRSATFTVFIPEKYVGRYSAEDIESAAESGAEFFGVSELEPNTREALGFSYEAVSYSTTEAIYFDLRRESKLPYGFARVKDPLIVCCNVTPEQIDALMGAGAGKH